MNRTYYMEQIEPPWDPVTVGNLNEFQQRGAFHPFTCGKNSDDVLVATPSGWECPDPNCEYRQYWAWAMMADPGWLHKP